MEWVGRDLSRSSSPTSPQRAGTSENIWGWKGPFEVIPPNLPTASRDIAERSGLGGTSAGHPVPTPYLQLDVKVDVFVAVMEQGKLAVKEQLLA